MTSNGPSTEIDVNKLLERPMHYIGLYVAGASLICTLAMAADTINGFRLKKYWFPSKYFPVEATSLTLLAVVMKLPVDLTTRMFTVTDRLAKVSSLVFMATAMANSFTCLGSMDDKDILMNVTALSILVITVTSNVIIQVIQVHSLLSRRLVFPEEILALGSMLLLLVMFISSALMITSTKRYLETKYKEMQKSALIEVQIETGEITTDKLRVIVKKYWIMAETSSIQFVVARSVTCTLSGMISLLISLVLIEAQIRMGREYRILNQSTSSYGWSTKWILLTQTAGVIIGTIAPASRWFTAISFRSSNEGSNSLKNALTVEGYWTQKMVDWKQSSLSENIRYLKARKVVHGLRGLFLNLCIFAQFLIVLSSKLVLLVSVRIISPPILCFNYVQRLNRGKHISDSGSSRHEEAPESTTEPDMDMKHYVMLLEGEMKLPTKTLKNICKEIDEIIQKGKKHKPENLLKLLHKSSNFNGVAEFDSHQVPSLHSENLLYCWSLPVVTLTSIALALPNIEKHKSTCLLNSVTEGLSIVKRVDKYFGKNNNLENIRTAADVVWVGVELYHKWQDNDLHETYLNGKNSSEVLQELSYKAEQTVMEFKRDTRDCIMRNPLNWPAKAIAANAMYRISRTISLTHGVESDKMAEEMFEYISIMIADIIAACLTNLARLITMKCHNKAIEKRWKGVRVAALLLGETEEILGLLQQRQMPVQLDPFQKAYIEEWRTSFNQEKKINQGLVSMPSADIDVSRSGKQEEANKTEIQAI